VKIFGNSMRIIITSVKITFKVERITKDTVVFLINDEPVTLQLDEVIQLMAGATSKMHIESIIKLLTYTVKVKFFTDFGLEKFLKLKARDSFKINLSLYNEGDPKGPDAGPPPSKPIQPIQGNKMEEVK
jgi:hypothetical protein